MLLLDVRTPTEYAQEHAEGAVNIPLQDIASGAIPAVPKDTKIVVYCRSGGRAGQSVAILEQKGFTNVISAGGLHDIVAS